MTNKLGDIRDRTTPAAILNSPLTSPCTLILTTHLPIPRLHLQRLPHRRVNDSSVTQWNKHTKRSQMSLRL